ncbi:MAG: phage virion morphogenesis protein [Treponema sp.]|nr:phage virion morphogenesis protein [Treponema sp.]
MGAAVEVNLSEIKKLAQKLTSFMLSGGDTDRLLNSLGEVVVGQTQERFDTLEDPHGDPWRELTKKYKARKILDSSGGILTRGGLMADSITFQLAGNDSILIGSPMEYADYHQNAKSEKRRREFLGINTDNIIELQDAIDIFMKEQVA